MMDILYTRMLLWKKSIFHMLFWLLLPVVGTFLFVSFTNSIQEDARVPIGIVLEEDSDLANELIESIKDSKFVDVHFYSEGQALYELEKHELDSVFIIHEGFEEAILSGKRNNIISSYRTELSFAFPPIKEMIVSLVQGESGRVKAAQFIQKMNEEYGGSESWDWDEIIQKTEQVHQEENLINTNFVYADNYNSSASPTLFAWKTWGVWAILSLLSSLFISDWIIREKKLAVSTRYIFMKMSRPSYYLQVITLYFLLFILFDLLSVTIFTLYLNEYFSIEFLFVLISFRLMLCLLTFFLAQCFNKTTTFYGVSIIITLILAVINGVVIPINGFMLDTNLTKLLNPLYSFINGETTIFWSIISIIAVILALLRKEEHHA